MWCAPSAVDLLGPHSRVERAVGRSVAWVSERAAVAGCPVLAAAVRERDDTERRRGVDHAYKLLCLHGDDGTAAHLDTAANDSRRAQAGRGERQQRRKSRRTLVVAHGTHAANASAYGIWMRLSPANSSHSWSACHAHTLGTPAAVYP